ncbi:type II toxin-antitoxin system ParD family antitoxin [Methylobacterium sp. WL120]|uniref:type II toxin-antitoxin system ParD family antitoxin n=1 Tax=Methylobacterium sp. WL120 TaxID=2603887 RepID=UPI0011C94440|nr:type II toxin-antitoxin system ParD family antitoxin [Methylobacterium sp. WL120]TXM69755.1 type II toxin-antitoxin system ParD family antitoxin [Methylobacterium sp. WL120]
MTKPIVLDPAEAAFVDGLVADGRYPSADRAVREGLRLLHAREARLSDLREAWNEGVASGDYEPIDALLDSLADDAATRVKAGA